MVYKMMIVFWLRCMVLFGDVVWFVLLICNNLRLGIVMRMLVWF